MLIPYTYNPALHDLFLYQPETVSWTIPDPDGNTSFSNVPAPYAWNPNSLLYGYRYSLEGLMAAYRWMGTAPPTAETWFPPYAAINDFNDPVNRPAFYNSWPPATAVIHPQFAWICAHAVYGAVSPPLPNDRNLSLVFDNIWGLGTRLTSGHSHRYIRGDNTLIHLSGTTLGYPYQRDTAFSSGLGDYIAAPGGADHGVVELPAPFPGNPLKVVDAQTIYPDAPVWCIDGSQKICGPIQFKRAGKSRGAPVEGGDASSAYMRLVQQVPDPGFRLFMHDSGSTFFVELKPPTSAAAGDGVLGFLPGTVITIGNLSPLRALPPASVNQSNTNQGIPSCILVAGDPEAALVSDYWAWRGYPDYPFTTPYTRTNQTLATETAAQNLLAEMQAFLTIMEARN